MAGVGGIGVEAVPTLASMRRAPRAGDIGVSHRVAGAKRQCVSAAGGDAGMHSRTNQAHDRFHTSQDSLDVENRLRPLAEGALSRKGYVEGAGTSDVVVRLAVGTTEFADVGLERCSIDDYECAGDWMHRLSVAFDIFDTATGAHVWHGTTDVALARPQFDQALLDGIVTKAFAELPRRQGT